MTPFDDYRDRDRRRYDHRNDAGWVQMIFGALLIIFLVFAGSWIPA